MDVAKSFWTDFEVFFYCAMPIPTTPPFLSNQPWTTFRHQHCIVIHNCITTTHYCTVIVCTSTTTGLLQFWNFMLLIWLVLYEMFCLFTSKSFSKGQLIISERLFGVFNFFQKMNKNKSTWGIIVSCSKVKFIRSFFGGYWWPRKPFRN